MSKSNFKLLSRAAWGALAVVTMLAVGYPSQLHAEAAPVSAPAAVAQITGEVYDSTDEPIIGAQVKVKGTSNVTATDIDGRFTLKCEPGAILEISYLGCKTQEVAAADGMKVVMQEDTQMLDEVVVVGYGTQKKATMTGSVAIVGEKQLANKGTLSSPVQALQGQVPGVIITRNSSAPGDESWSMSLRGAVSKNSSEPLIIIDGIEYESVNELRLINPSDIESINFLKDAAASIYGSKAAGGVVLVTTKKAKDDKVRVDYNGSYTFKHIGLSPKLMNLDEWSDAVLQARYNDGYGETDTWVRYAKLAQYYKNHYIDFTTSGNPFGSAFSDTEDLVFFDTDWQKIMWGDSWSTQHELSIAGGKSNNTFRLSLGYMYDDSNLKWGNNSNNRFNLRLSNNFQIAKNLTLESVIAYNRQDQVAPTQIGSALTASTQQPGFPSSTVDGKPYGWGTWAAPNWQAELGGDNKLKVSAVNISETFRYQIIPGLQAVATLGYNTSTARRNTKSESIDFYNYAGTIKTLVKPVASDSYFVSSYSNTDFYSVQGYLDWARTFNDVHNLKLMGGIQYNLKQYEYFLAKAENIQPSLEVVNGIGTVYLTNGSSKPAAWEEAILSYYGRANYDYKSRYMIEGQIRYDGSSKFQPENRWAAFWGVSAGWRLGQESWMDWSRSWLDDLKLRASYGNVGNQSGIDRYSGVLLYNFFQGTGAYVGQGQLSYFDTNGKLVSTDRTWERVHNYNIAVDLSLFNSRLTATAERFWKRTNNMLIDVLYPAILGDAAPTANRGKFKAWGYEGNITWNDRIGDWAYHVGGTFTYADNMLVDNGGSGAILNGQRSDREGYPLNSIFGLRYCGKLQNESQLEMYKEHYAETSTVGNINLLRVGDNMYEDDNKDGILDANDYVYLGTNDPKIQFSFNAGLEWKGFDLNVIFQGAAKRTIWRCDGNGNADIWRVPMRAVYMNGSNHFVGNVWSPETPDARYPTLTNKGDINNYNYQCSSWSVEDGSYLRLKNITLGYTVPARALAKTKVISNIRVYVTGTDLWELSHIHDGWDPEASNRVSNASRYPFLRTWTLGANISF